MKNGCIADAEQFLMVELHRVLVMTLLEML